MDRRCATVCALATVGVGLVLLTISRSPAAVVALVVGVAGWAGYFGFDALARRAGKTEKG
jgi:hypothetical protein